GRNCAVPLPALGQDVVRNGDRDVGRPQRGARVDGERLGLDPVRRRQVRAADEAHLVEGPDALEGIARLDAARARCFEHEAVAVGRNVFDSESSYWNCAAEDFDGGADDAALPRRSGRRDDRAVDRGYCSAAYGGKVENPRLVLCLAIRPTAVEAE